MKLEIKIWYDKSLASGKDEAEAIKDGIKKAIETAAHLHPGMSVQNLSEQITAALYEELAALKKADEALLQYAFGILIDTVQKPKEKEIEHLIIEIDRLQRHLSTEEEELRRSLRELFMGIERAAVLLQDDYFLGNIDQPASQVSAVGGPQGGVGQTFPGSVG
jgi:hypothetical protein